MCFCPDQNGSKVAPNKDRLTVVQLAPPMYCSFTFLCTKMTPVNHFQDVHFQTLWDHNLVHFQNVLFDSHLGPKPLFPSIWYLCFYARGSMPNYPTPGYICMSNLSWTSHSSLEKENSRRNHSCVSPTMGCLS